MQGRDGVAVTILEVQRPGAANIQLSDDLGRWGLRCSAVGSLLRLVLEPVGHYHHNKQTKGPDPWKKLSNLMPNGARRLIRCNITFCVRRALSAPLPES